MALRDAGHRIVNLACGLGSEGEQERRLRELQEATARAGFELALHDPTQPLERALAELIPREQVSLVVSPSPHDGHPAHELVGRATRDALRAFGAESPRWWMWGLWADLPLPTLMFEFDSERLEQVLFALSAHAGELARNDYRVLVEARARMNSVLGPERVFGFGSAGTDADFAELLTEAVLVDGSWHLGVPRLLDPSDPLPLGQSSARMLYESKG
jgi:LmbE family N-acetylglucosaminyl deacetylase